MGRRRANAHESLLHAADAGGASSSNAAAPRLPVSGHDVFFDQLAAASGGAGASSHPEGLAGPVGGGRHHPHHPHCSGDAQSPLGSRPSSGTVLQPWSGLGLNSNSNAPGSPSSSSSAAHPSQYHYVPPEGTYAAVADLMRGRKAPSTTAAAGGGGPNAWPTAVPPAPAAAWHGANASAGALPAPPLPAGFLAQHAAEHGLGLHPSQHHGKSKSTPWPDVEGEAAGRGSELLERIRARSRSGAHSLGLDAAALQQLLAIEAEAASRQGTPARSAPARGKSASSLRTLVASAAASMAAEEEQGDGGAGGSVVADGDAKQEGGGGGGGLESPAGGAKSAAGGGAAWALKKESEAMAQRQLEIAMSMLAQDPLMRHGRL